MMKHGNAILAIVVLTCAWCVTAAGRQDQTRGLRIKKVEESRPASTAPDTSGQPRTYRSTNSTVSSTEMRKSASASESILGVTLWRLRPAQSVDNKDARILEQKAANSAEWTAERIEAATPLSEGDRVRIRIDSPTTGYL